MVVQVLGKKRNRQNKARAALRLIKTTLPALSSIVAFNAAYPTAQDRNTVQIQLLEAHGLILAHIMRELKEDIDDE